MVRPSISSIEVSRPDATLYIERRGGDGPPVLLIPGAGADHYALLAQIRALEDAGFTTYALDPRGVGRSSRPAHGYHLDVFVEDVLSILDDLRLPSVHLFGHSLGSVTALLAAQRAPQRVASVIAASPWHVTDNFLRHSLSLAVTLVRTFPPETYAPWLLTFLASPQYLSDPERMGAMARSMFLGYRAPSPAVLSQHLSVGLDLDLRPVLPDLKLPVLILSATGDRMIPDSYSAAVAALLPQGRHVSFDGDGASHIFHFERATEVNTAILHFLATF